MVFGKNWQEKLDGYIPRTQNVSWPVLRMTYKVLKYNGLLAALVRGVDCPCAGRITSSFVATVAVSMGSGQLVTGKRSPIRHLRKDCKGRSGISAFSTQPDVCGRPQLPYPLRNQRRQELVERRAIQLR